VMDAREDGGQSVIREETEPRAARVEHHVTGVLSDSSVHEVSEVVAVVDHTNWEAVCAAFVVQELLKQEFPLESLVPQVLGPLDSIPRKTSMMLVICSNGCFQRAEFVRQLFEGQALMVKVVPIVAHANFQFPTSAFYEGLRDLSPHLLHGMPHMSYHLIHLIKRIFREIAIHVQMQESERTLQVRGRTIAKRLSCATLKPLSQMVEMKREISDGFDLNFDEASEPTEMDIFDVRSPTLDSGGIPDYMCVEVHD